MRNKTAELVVKPRYSPRLKLFVAAFATLAMIGSSYGAYHWGLSAAGHEWGSAGRYQQELLEQIQKLRQEGQDLRDSLARAQLQLDMDKTAYQELERSTTASSHELVQLREELSFYRNIISPPNKVSGLQIQRFDLFPVAENEYRYKLVLIQALKHDHSVTGHVRLDVIGQQNGKEAKVSFPESSKPIRINFKYFQDIEGSLALPPNFTPLSVQVSVVPGKGSQVEQAYPWPTI